MPGNKYFSENTEIYVRISRYLELLYIFFISLVISIYSSLRLIYMEPGALQWSGLTLSFSPRLLVSLTVLSVVAVLGCAIREPALAIPWIGLTFYHLLMEHPYDIAENVMKTKCLSGTATIVIVFSSFLLAVYLWGQIVVMYLKLLMIQRIRKNCEDEKLEDTDKETHINRNSISNNADSTILLGADLTHGNTSSSRELHQNKTGVKKKEYQNPGVT